MDRHNNGRTASPESGLERREQMQKSVKKSNKKTGAAGKYTASGAFGGAQPSNLVELIEAQRGKAASSAGKKPAADTALANKWANLQLQSFGDRRAAGGANGWRLAPQQRRKAEKHGVGKRMGEFAAAKLRTVRGGHAFPHMGACGGNPGDDSGRTRTGGAVV